MMVAVSPDARTSLKVVLPGLSFLLGFFSFGGFACGAGIVGVHDAVAVTVGVGAIGVGV